MANSDHPLRIGAVSYLNTKPLVYQLAELAPEIELVFDLPSRLAERLDQSDLDVALIPSIELLQNPQYAVVSDACIACKGPVWSVRLLSRVPFDRVRSVALDEGSRTSVALTKILLAEKFGTDPATSNLRMQDDPFAVQTDALLIIGDRAMNSSNSQFPYQWDLGDQWLKLTGLPFVFAMWTARRGVDLNGLEFQLGRARDEGVKNVEQIAREQCSNYELSYEQTLSYLRDNLHFQLGEDECAGLTLFREHAIKLGMAPEDVEINFYDCNAT